MRKFISLVLAVSILLVVGLNSAVVQAAVQYTYSYNFTNRYNTEQITYTFSNLDANTTYTWVIYTVDIRTGGLKETFGRFTSTPDDRSGSPTDEVMTFGGVDFSAPIGTIVYPQGYVGPIAVADSNATILGKHFIAELPTFVTTPDSEWFDGGSGNTALGERQVIGNTQFTGSCRNPVYNAFNADGWQHSFTPCSVATLEDGWAILHYQITSAYDPAMDDHQIIFFRVPSASEELDLSLNELIAYQQTAAYSPGATQAWFVIVNTSGDLLPFLDNTRCAASFTQFRSPCLSEMIPQIYNYGRFDGGTPNWISDGESVWMVTQDPDLREWIITATVNQVGEGGRQTLVTTAVTEAIWDSYHGAQIVVDTFSGFTDSTVYPFTLSRNHTYTVAGTSQDDVIVGWSNRATAINSGLATTTEMSFLVIDHFDIVPIPTLEELLNEVLNNTGLNNPPGKAALLTMLLFVGMFATAGFTMLRANILAYLVVWTGIGGVFILGGFSTLLVTTVWGILTIFLWLVGIMMLNGGGQTDESF